jgi:hypothetical protein
MSNRPIALMVVPRTVANFILYDQGQDLLRAEGVVPVEAPRIPHGALGRTPDAIGRAVARALARGLRPPGTPAVVMMFHPFQWPYIEALLKRWPQAELWYGLFDRTTHAPDADAKTRARLEELHRRAAERADLTFAVSTTLVDVETAAGREALLMPSAADSFPAPQVQDDIIAVSFGNLGQRTDWSVLRGLAQRIPELTLLMVGRLDEKAVAGNTDYEACRAAPQFVWLGRRSNDEAARLIMCADVGLLPMPMDEFNDAGLPNRILKAARVGRLTVAPEFTGIDVWARSLIRCKDLDAWEAAVRSQRGRRVEPDLELRDWALRQTGEHQDRELWRRLRALGVAVPEGAGIGTDGPTFEELGAPGVVSE